MSDTWVVMLPGVRWDDVPGTDKQLAVALGEQTNVLWVDPAYPATVLARGTTVRRNLHEVAPGVHRLQPIGPQGGSRVGIRSWSARAVQRRLAHELEARRIEPLATIRLTARLDFPQRSGVKVFYLTDDWVAGAAMMGLSPSWILDRMRRGLARADLALTVTPDLAEVVRSYAPSGLPVEVLPNGTRLTPRDTDALREPVAGLVGQLNERLDYELLTRLAEAQIQLRLIGPRTVRDPVSAAKLDALLAHVGVEWLGPVPQQALAEHLSRISVGLTPYVDSAFNRSSFPLKTLEYLGAGIPVVSSDLPAARWLDTPHVAIGSTPEEFSRLVREGLERPQDPDAERSRIEFARAHTWSARAADLLELVRRLDH